MLEGLPLQISKYIAKHREKKKKRRNKTKEKSGIGTKPKCKNI
jgi:hypothetical protein